MMARLTEHERGFRYGVAIALADLNRMFDQPTMVSEVLGNFGYTIAMLKTAGVETYDLKELRKALR